MIFIKEVLKKIIKIHGCFIKGENDSNEDLVELTDRINEFELNVEYNIVRFNPDVNSLYQESDRLEEISKMLRYFTNSCGGVRLIPRVGPSAYASCGMFPTPEDI